MVNAILEKDSRTTFKHESDAYICYSVKLNAIFITDITAVHIMSIIPQ